MITKARLNKILASGKLDTEEDYWLEQLSGELAMSRIPHDLGPAREEYQRASLKFEFPADISRKIIKISKGSEQRLFILLMAGVKAILHKYSGNKDIIIGTPITGKKTEKNIFNHLLALRTRLDDEMNFKELLGAVNNTIAGGMKNQNYPFYKLLELLEVESDQSRFPLSGVMVLFENIQKRDYLDKKADLLFSFSMTGKSIKASLEYDSLLYREETINRVKTHLLRFFSQVTSQPGLALKDVELLTSAEKEMMVVDWNDTDATYPDGMTLHQLFEEQVRENPERVALVCGEEKLSYQELNKKANQLAHHLRQQGVKSDTLIAILLERSVEMVISILAILKAGGAYLPIDPGYPEDRIEYMLDDSQAPILISEQKLLTELELELDRVVIDIRDREIENENQNNLDNINKPGDLAYIIYTSGSTGRPKGVMIRSEERRVGKECTLRCRSRWSPYH